MCEIIELFPDSAKDSYDISDSVNQYIEQDLVITVIEALIDYRSAVRQNTALGIRDKAGIDNISKGDAMITDAMAEGLIRLIRGD